MKSLNIVGDIIKNTKQSGLVTDLLHQSLYVNKMAHMYKLFTCALDSDKQCVYDLVCLPRGTLRKTQAFKKRDDMTIERLIRMTQDDNFQSQQTSEKQNHG